MFSFISHSLFMPVCMFVYLLVRPIMLIRRRFVFLGSDSKSRGWGSVDNAALCIESNFNPSLPNHMWNIRVYIYICVCLVLRLTLSSLSTTTSMLLLAFMSSCLCAAVKYIQFQSNKWLIFLFTTYNEIHTLKNNACRTQNQIENV